MPGDRPTTDLEIAGLRCGGTRPPLLVAELSGNHAGRLAHALALIDAAVDAGADLIKIQTYRPDTITLDCDRPEFRIDDGLWRGRSLYELYEEAHTPWEWHPALFARARERGVPLFSSPFDPSAVDLLESLDCPAYKIASFELVDIGLLERVAATGKPVILSTGMATLAEIDEALQVFEEGPPAGWCCCIAPAPIRRLSMQRICAHWTCFAGTSRSTSGCPITRRGTWSRSPPLHWVRA